MTDNKSHYQECSGCGTSYDVSDLKPGDTFECRECNRTVRVRPGSGSGARRRSTRKGSDSSRSRGRKDQQSGGRTKNQGQRSSASRSSRGTGKTERIVMVLIGVAIVGFVGLIIFSGGGGDSTPQENTEETVQQGAEDTEDENGESPEETSETGETTETSGNNEGDENQDAEESGNENRTGDSNSSSDQQEQGDNESEQTGSPDDERSEKLANGHLKHDESVKNEFIETFQNAESMGSSELETALADFAEKYDRETLIPALIEAYREADAWVAAQANELLEKIAHKNTSDPRGLSEEGRMTNYEDLKSWWIYTDIDSLIARIERREKLNRQQEELIPLLKDYVSNISQTRWNAENKLRQMGKDYIPAMIDLIDNSRQMAAAQGAHKFLNDITSNNLGEFPTAADKRDELKRNWQEWWENNRNEVQIQE